jgi:hypothetical protein
MLETWKNITLYPLYQVSDLGRVRNKYGHVLKPIRRNRELCVYLKNPILKRFEWRRVSALVLREFKPQQRKLGHVYHINKDYNDNRACNLKWIYGKEFSRRVQLTKNQFHQILEP